MVFNKKEYSRKYQLEYYRKNKEILKAKAKEYYKGEGGKKHREWEQKHKEERKEKNKMRYENLKFKVFDHYSCQKLKCACCGEREFKFLTLDHIKNDGGKQRKEIGRSPAIWRWLVKNNFPLGYQVLCFNCNQAKGIYGYCPHKKALKPEETKQLIRELKREEK